MHKVYPLNREENIVMLASEITYAQKPYWCNATVRQMSFSFMSPRKYYDYDRKEVQPCIVFICGGGFEKQDRNSWTVEMSYFAKHGYSVAIVDYSVLPFTRWPEQLEDVKAAIRFIRAHAKELWIDPDRIGVMGESAGGYLATMVGVTGDTKEFDRGDNLDQSSAVSCVVPLWAGGNPNRPGAGHKVIRQGESQIAGAPDSADYMNGNTPPFCLVCGTADAFCYEGSKDLRDTLRSKGIDTTYLEIEGAGHADAGAVNSAVKADILAFLDKHLK